MKKTFISNNSKETKLIGKNIAEDIMIKIQDKSLSDTVVLELIGDLGGGKTTFLQGFAKGLRIKEKISSPTFIIAKSYKIPIFYNKSDHIGYDKKFTFCHADCYRLGNIKKSRILELKKFLFGQHRIVAIEWSNNIQKSIPQNTIKITFLFVDKNTRKINIDFPVKFITKKS